jgi:flavin reductase (DIM6/NTAB) family NADH-FMN oxidoreductase RutF
MSQFASGVTVVTTTFDGHNYGLTVSAFTSVSLDPPLVLVCIDKRVHPHDMISMAGVFAVNILCEDQVELGMRFAGMVPGIADRFDGLEYATATTGSPILSETLGWVDCAVWRQYDGGDHSIFVGEVLQSSTSTKFPPLLYHNREWRRSAALDLE